MISLSVKRRINVPLDELWTVAADFARAPEPSMGIEIAERGDAARGGVGCVRHIRSGARVIVERLNAVEPMRGYSYEMLSGVPVKGYIGRVDFTADGGATVVTRSAAFRSKIPGLGWLIKALTVRSYNRFLDELEKLGEGDAR